MDINELSEELKAKARACTTPEELLALAKEEGVELSDADLESVSGGAHWLCDGYSCICSPHYGDPH